MFVVPGSMELDASPAVHPPKTHIFGPFDVCTSERECPDRRVGWHLRVERVKWRGERASGASEHSACETKHFCTEL